MKVNVKITRGESSNKSIMIKDGSTYNDVLSSFNINPETVIIIVNNRPVPVNEKIFTDHMEILMITSRG
ncbi:MAG: Small archaeal modifier protein 2 [ANME-2 cluster archaeon HR1]|nr:MAG: Sulfur carrier protein ThiS (thiamine biosynthesis) [ANME-2 cluster archaeon]KAF5425415.1 Sulfur carrier protein ThiS (thiamine biosynthesis) [ANME-2 cluster archaeon]PPA80167.1 MAG: Small archaeal modifier protein 2 [ANME-2 cluster archaeon HR1]